MSNRSDTPDQRKIDHFLEVMATPRDERSQTDPGFVAGFVQDHLQEKPKKGTPLREAWDAWQKEQQEIEEEKQAKALNPDPRVSGTKVGAAIGVLAEHGASDEEIADMLGEHGGKRQVESARKWLSIANWTITVAVGAILTLGLARAGCATRDAINRLQNEAEKRQQRIDDLAAPEGAKPPGPAR